MKIPSSIQETKIICKGLQISLSHKSINQILISSWPWTLFGSNDQMIFNALLRKIYNWQRFICFGKMKVGRVLLFLLKEYFWEKKLLKNTIFSLKQVMNSSLWMIERKQKKFPFHCEKCWELTSSISDLISLKRVYLLVSNSTLF